MSPVPQTSSLGFVEGVAQPLEKRFEVIKEVGDGSFGSVVLARVRGTRNMVPPPPPYHLNHNWRANSEGRRQIDEKVL
jgi:hypothetical protein